MAALSLIASVLLPIRLDWLGATRTEIGVALALVALGGLLSRPAVGWALDAVGRKAVINVGIFCSVVGITVLGFVEAIGPLLYATQVFWGIGVGAFFTGIFTFAADHIPESRRTQGMAIFGVFGLIPLGLYGIVETLDINAESLHRVFWVVAALVATSFVFLSTVPELPRLATNATRTDEPEALGARLTQVRRGLLTPSLMPVWLADILFGMMFAVFLAFAAVTATREGMESPGHIWLAYAALALGVRTIGSGLMYRVGAERIVVPALGLYVIAMGLMAFAHTSWMFVLAGAFAGAAHGYCFPILASLVVTRSNDAVRGIGFAFYTGLWDFCLFAMRPLCGWVADQWGDRAMYSGVAIAVGIGMVALVWLERRAKLQEVAA